LKYTVKVPIIGYGEFFLDLEEPLDEDEIKFRLEEGELDLVPLQEGIIKEFTLSASLDDFDIPEWWPIDIQVKPISNLN
jgi:hypothetical protein